MKSIKGHNNTPLNEIIDITANHASLSLQLNLLACNTITSHFTKKYNKTFLPQPTSSNEDLGKFILKLVNF
jgi:hypothetical protein